MVSLRLAGRPDAASVARQSLSRLEGDLDTDLLDTLRLLVTEFVTNSIRHAQATVVDLRVHVTEHQVRLEVSEQGPGFEPARRAPGQDLEGGWGLYLVDRLASRWGVSNVDGVSRVWAELDRRRQRTQDLQPL